MHDVRGESCSCDSPHLFFTENPLSGGSFSHFRQSLHPIIGCHAGKGCQWLLEIRTVYLLYADVFGKALHLQTIRSNMPKAPLNGTAYAAPDRRVCASRHSASENCQSCSFVSGVTVSFARYCRTSKNKFGLDTAPRPNMSACGSFGNALNR